MSSKTDTVVKLVLVFFISLLSFSVGTFVGKKYSDNQHKLSQLEPHSAERKVASEHQENKEGEHASASAEEGHSAVAEHEASDKALNDEDVAKMAQEFVEDEKDTATAGTAATKSAHEAGHGPAAAEPAHAVAVAEAAHAPAKKAAGKAKTMTVSEALAQSEAAAAEESATTSEAHTADKRKPSSLPAKPVQYPVGKFTVQIGSFPTESEAQNKAADLKKQGYAAYYVPAQIKDKTWYRVSIGQFSSPKEAQDYKNQYVEKSGSASAIVQKIVE
ncbi:MAG: SPOR domain-containing protein [Pseudobdellovibrionaceae bacterium]